MIADGFLSGMTDLIFVKGCKLTASAAANIADWANSGGRVWYASGCDPSILETDEAFTVGLAFEDWNRFGFNDGCFRTDHGDVLSCYSPVTHEIVYTAK